MGSVDINSVNLVGRLTRDAELKYTNTGMAMSKISIASNRSVKKNDSWTEEVSFFDCTLWGKTAEALQPYLLKGKQVAVTGELRQNRWDQDGQTRSKVEININNIQLLGGKSETTYSPQGSAPPPAADKTDDIPF